MRFENDPVEKVDLPIKHGDFPTKCRKFLDSLKQYDWYYVDVLYNKRICSCHVYMIHIFPNTNDGFQWDWKGYKWWFDDES